MVQALASETGRKSFTFQTIAGILNAVEHQDGTISVDMGKPVFAWDKIPLSEEFHDTSRIELQIGRSTRRSCIRPRPCRWAIRMPSSGLIAIR